MNYSGNNCELPFGHSAWSTQIFLAYTDFYCSYYHLQLSKPFLIPRPFLPQLKGLTEGDRERARGMLVLVGLGWLGKLPRCHGSQPKFTVKTHVTYFARNYGKREKFR